MPWKLFKTTITITKFAGKLLQVPMFKIVVELLPVMLTEIVVDQLQVAITERVVKLLKVLMRESNVKLSQLAMTQKVVGLICRGSKMSEIFYHAPGSRSKTNVSGQTVPLKTIVRRHPVYHQAWPCFQRLSLRILIWIKSNPNWNFENCRTQAGIL